MNQLTKLAHRFSAFLAGLEMGQEDCAMNQWGDPRASFFAWKRWLEERGEWNQELDDYTAYRNGYEKALILNKGQGIVSHPNDKEVWEEYHHPWGENISRLSPAGKDLVKKVY